MEDQKKELEIQEKLKAENSKKIEQIRAKLTDEKTGSENMDSVKKALEELEKEAKEINKKYEELQNKEKVFAEVLFEFIFKRIILESALECRYD